MSATTGLDADKLLGLNEVMAILSARRWTGPTFSRRA